MLKIYTDGATSNNGNKDAVGGWAFIIVDENEQIIAQQQGHIEHATNNICELIAIIKGCQAVPNKKEVVNIYSDSAYCINCYQNKWYYKWRENGWKNSKKQPVANKELWEQLIPFFEDKNFNFLKVQGHSTDEYNNIVDRMAVDAKTNKHYQLY